MQNYTTGQEVDISKVARLEALEPIRRDGETKAWKMKLLEAHARKENLQFYLPFPILYVLEETAGRTAMAGRPEAFRTWQEKERQLRKSGDFANLVYADQWRSLTEFAAGTPLDKMTHLNVERIQQFIAAAVSPMLTLMAHEIVDPKMDPKHMIVTSEDRQGAKIVLTGMESIAGRGGRNPDRILRGANRIYLAPEQKMENGAWDAPTSPVYNLGAIAEELLQDAYRIPQNPSGAQNVNAMREALKRKETGMDGSVDHIMDFIAAATQDDPKSRPKSANELYGLLGVKNPRPQPEPRQRV